MHCVGGIPKESVSKLRRALLIMSNLSKNPGLSLLTPGCLFCHKILMKAVNEVIKEAELNEVLDIVFADSGLLIFGQKLTHFESATEL